MLTKQTWWIIGLGLLLLAYALFRWQDEIKVRHAAELAAQARAADLEIQRVQGLATSLSFQNAKTEAALDSLAQHDAALGRALAQAKAKTPPMPPGPVPEDCGPYAARAQGLAVELAVADSQLTVKQVRIDSLTSAGHQKDGLIAQQVAALKLAQDALKPHEKVELPQTSHKLLGLIPMPTAQVGVGVVYSGGNVYGGPGASFGWSIKL